jgi:choline dehydrogenase-like flavoprotein
MRVRGTSDRAALGHACGTCRFGADPDTSVLDRWNRAHEVSNLYVVDGSFFPTSGGLNPALTIAANALRVAHHLESTIPADPAAQ